MSRIILIDNYDSFTYNLVHAIRSGGDFLVDVVRNDKADLKEIDRYDGIVLSPGPGLPEESGLLKQIVSHYAGNKRILGVCLGLQAIAEVFGGTLRQLSTVHHGLALPVHVQDASHYLFQGLPYIFMGGRYHSWVADPDTLPECLRIIATDPDEQIMALTHREYDVCGLQFHPESILTPLGGTLIDNWLKKGFNH